jgi:mannose-6-phosphate isomerase-like protein (cupin superfamily)
MLVKKNQSKKHQNSENCTVWEYEYPSELFSFATALINGRYPAEKRSVNLGCEEAYYVISGEGIIHSEFGDFKIEQGDLYFFKKGEKYWVEGQDLFLGLANAPKWTPEQYNNVD